MAEGLKLSDSELEMTMIHVLRTLMEKVGLVQKQVIQAGRWEL